MQNLSQPTRSRDVRRSRSAPYWAVLLFAIMTCARAREATAQDARTELSAIMTELDTDSLQATKRLLALCEPPPGNEATLEPAVVHSLVLAARTVGRQGHWRESIELLTRAHQAVVAMPKTNAIDNTFLHTIDLAIASAAMQCGDGDLAIKHSDAVVNDLNAPAQHRAAAYPMLVKAFQIESRFDEASQVLADAAADEDKNVVSPQLADAALLLGTVSLQQKNANAAKKAFQIYLVMSPEGTKRVDAVLGEAWAAALGADTPELAAEKLLSFAKQYPSHRDSPHALRASATCSDQANQAAQAEVVRQQLLESYPDSDAAVAVLDRYAQAGAPWPETVRHVWKIRLATTTATSPAIPSNQLALVFTEALLSSDDELWQAAVSYLIKHDVDGTQTDATLKQFATQQQDALAEHLAVDLIARAEGDAPLNSPAATETACRWAGTQERWTMLALAADELGPPSEASHRSLTIDRILAEALMQTQRPSEAMPWWDWLIEERNASDFATLLRGAETAVAHGDLEVATQRIEAANVAAGDVAFNRELVRILSSELSIRRARFDEARETLTEIVRSPDPSPTLRPRAQWLIGETYFLQQRYADAINAYRRVDSMDTAGQWAPAALLQAGKAFEKLGRSREAATCYTALLTRYRDWPHATVAQTRLATLSPSAPSSSTAPILR